MIKKLVLIFSIFITLSIFSPVDILAGRNQSEQKIVVLPKDQVVNKDYFAAGDTVTLSGRVNGDAYLAGGNVTVEGRINGDLLAAGGVVNVRGRVANDVRVAGGQIIISGEIGSNVTAVGGSVTLTDSAKIAGSLVSGSGSLNVFSPLGKGVTIGAGQATFGNQVNGDIVAGVGQISLTPNAVITGDLNYWSNSEAQVQPGAKVLGKITQNLPPEEVAREFQPTKFLAILAGVGLVFKIISLVSALIIGLLLLKFKPIFTQRTTDVVNSRPWASLGIGFLAVIIIPIIFILLLISVVGIPIAFILIVSFLIVIYLAKIFVSLLLGQKILALFSQKIAIGWTFVLGLIVYGILTSIPVFGWIISLVVVLLGLGAVILEEKNFYKLLRSKKLI